MKRCDHWKGEEAEQTKECLYLNCFSCLQSFDLVWWSENSALNVFHVFIFEMKNLSVFINMTEFQMYIVSHPLIDYFLFFIWLHIANIFHFALIDFCFFISFSFCIFIFWKYCWVIDFDFPWLWHWIAHIVIDAWVCTHTVIDGEILQSFPFIQLALGDWKYTKSECRSNTSKHP